MATSGSQGVHLRQPDRRIHRPQNSQKKMRKLSEDLELPKLTFQVIRRTIATLAQKKGTPKDIQALLRYSRLEMTGRNRK